MNVLIVSTVKSKWPVLRVGLANVQLLIAVVAIWFLVLLPDHRNGLMWFATAIIVGTLLIAVFDYWSAVSRIEMGSTHVHLVFSLRRVTIEYCPFQFDLTGLGLQASFFAAWNSGAQASFVRGLSSLSNDYYGAALGLGAGLGGGAAALVTYTKYQGTIIIDLNGGGGE